MPTLASLLADWLPSQCHICRAWPSRPVCGRCLASFAPAVPRCDRCALPLPLPGQSDAPPLCGACRLSPPPMRLTRVALPYAWPWTALIARLKFHQDVGMAVTLAGLLRQAPGVAALLREADGAAPVPTALPRLIQRGYNPAWLLARHLGARRAWPDALLRPTDGPAQHTLKRADRLARVRNAFVPNPALATALKGRHILLIDDVMTTGATVGAAAEALLQGGAAQVSVLALARTAPGEAAAPPPALPAHEYA